MATITHTCPHCLTEHVALRLLSYSNLTGGWAAYLRCQKCGMPSCAVIHHHTQLHSVQEALKTDKDLTWACPIANFWPPPPAPLIPENLPPDVARIYLQAERNFPVVGNEEAAGTMYGKALDIALLKIDPNLKGTLGPKIKKLAADGRLTPDLAEWSDEIRDIRNDAAHEEASLSRDDLTALRSFSEMVLRYLFSLPNAVRKRRGEKLPWEEAAEAS